MTLCRCSGFLELFENDDWRPCECAPVLVRVLARLWPERVVVRRETVPAKFYQA